MEIKPKQVHIAIYVIITIAIAISSWQTYQRWLNPLGLKPEKNPKIQDGSQEFTPPVEFESSVRPAPNEDGVTIYPQLDRFSREDDLVEIETPDTEDNTATPQILEEE